jgi:PPP family 3-phenylpropionic acid transporter
MPETTEAADRRAHRAFRFLFLGIGTWSAAVGPFSSVMLRSHGVDTATIGLLSAFGAVAATVLVPIWGHVADVLAGRAKAFRVGLALAFVAAVALLLPLPLQVFALVLASFAVFPSVFAALGDALAVGGLRAPERQYGALRARASLSFGAGAIVAGFLYNEAGYAAVPLVSIVWSGALFYILGRVPDTTRSAGVRALAAVHGGAEAAGRFGSISRAVSVQPRLWAVLAVFTLAYAGIMGAGTFVGIRIVELGGQPSDVALTFGISSFAEIPGLVLAAWIGRRIGIRWLVCLALVGYGLCVVSWGILPSPITINATRIATGLTFGTLIAARVLVIARLLPTELQATGQTMLQAATFGLGTALGSIVGGALYGAIGPMGFFVVAGGLCIGGGIGAWIVLYGPVGEPTRAVERVEIAVE